MAKASTRASRKWNENNLDRLSITVPKGQKAAIAEHAQARGESLNGFVNRAIKETVERDGVKC